jgi:hypothetical protein
MKKIIEWLAKKNGYDYIMLWKKADKFKVTKRMASGKEKFIMNTKEDLDWFVVYKNNQFENILVV